jgi:hypothetical protein
MVFDLRADAATPVLVCLDAVSTAKDADGNCGAMKKCIN